MNSAIESRLQGYKDSPCLLKVFVKSRLIRNKEMGHPQSRVTILASDFVKSGREGLQTLDKELGGLDRPPEEILEIYKLKAPEDLSAVIIGCSIIALDEAMYDGYFSFPDFHSRMTEAVRGTKISFPVEECEAIEELEEKKFKKMLAAIKQEHSFFSFFANPSLLPDSLRKYLFETLGIPNEPFKTSVIKVLDDFRKLSSYIPPPWKK